MTDAIARAAATVEAEALYTPTPPTEEERAHRRALADEARRQLDAARHRNGED